jgi:catechol 2,3-dioxygenase-like lactoylglutathione lyase family enzyme
VTTANLGSVQCVVLDCPDPEALAGFYQAILGGAVNEPDARWSTGAAFATLHTAAGLVLAFQRVPARQLPRWPDPAFPQQSHLDIEVPDLPAARAQAAGLGATPLRADGRGWEILADPAGLPFCLLPARPRLAGQPGSSC